MDQKRLIVAIAISIGILLLFDFYNRPAREAQQRAQQQAAQQVAPAPPAAVPVPAASGAVPVPAASGAAPVPAGPAAVPARTEASATPDRPAATRLAIESPRLAGSLNLRGLRLDDLVLSDYRETVAPSSPRVRLLASSRAVARSKSRWA